MTAHPKPKPKPKKRRVLRAHPEVPLATWCQVHRAGVCTGRAEHRHHVAGRSDHDNTLDVCHACHAWIHAEPAKSYALGFMQHRNGACPKCNWVGGHWKGCEG